MNPKLPLWLVCAALIFAEPLAAQHTLNVRDADIRAFVQDAARVTGQTFIVDGRVTGKVSVVTDRPLSRSEYFEVFLSTLRANGLVAIPMRGGGYRVQPSEGAATQPSRVGSKTAAPSQFVTEVFRLRSIDATTAVETLRPLVSREGSITANRNANSLVVADYADNLRRIRELVRQIDRDSAATQIVTLDNAGAREIALALQGLAGQGGGEGGRPPVTVAAIDSSNAIALRGDPTSVARFAAMAKQLDARAQSGAEIRVYRLEHANAETLLETVQSLIGGQKGVDPVADIPPVAAPAGAASAPVSVPSPVTSVSSANGMNGIGGRGPVVVTRYEGANALIVAANPEMQRMLGELIRQLDTRPEQVLVEAIVVEIGNDAAKKLGVQFLVGGENLPFAATNYSNATPNILTIAGAIGAEELTRTTTTVNGNTTTTSTNSALGDSLQEAAAASILSATGGFGGFALDIGKNAVFGTIINAIAADTESNLLATPHIVTLNNQKAKFLVGQEVPVSTGEQLSANFENAFRTVQRQEVGIKLEVTPQVNSQGDVKLFLKQEVSSVAGPVSSRSSDLILNKREFETTLTVGDGQLLAIGGLLNDDERRTIERIPLLSDIPLIGELFKSRSRSRSKTNLMVFIRPTILRSKADGDRLTARRYDYVRGMQLARNPDIEPSIDDLLRDYMGAVPPIAPEAGPNDVVVGATNVLERPTSNGALQPADIPPSNIIQTDGDGR
ncbi:type II secretion system secretin GspD [Sphingorhabdus contaminans]|uniref:Type II secretion system protein GspD n=1 Tax=Sphingorhabdus contaminans TaxID=1343899 RepID=A0A553WHY4_9SPHN|nr:type II secretion system secretin GspD [Sphingorhabdus contaminans]TSB04292.1 type II secretion system protein GspD [Sphingorhabdus contaminans]